MYYLLYTRCKLGGDDERKLPSMGRRGSFLFCSPLSLEISGGSIRCRMPSCHTVLHHQNIFNRAKPHGRRFMPVRPILKFPHILCPSHRNTELCSRSLDPTGDSLIPYFSQTLDDIIKSYFNICWNEGSETELGNKSKSSFYH